MTWQPMITAPLRGPALLFARLVTHDTPVVLVGYYAVDRWMTCVFSGQKPLEVVPLAWMPLPDHPGLAPSRLFPAQPYLLSGGREAVIEECAKTVLDHGMALDRFHFGALAFARYSADAIRALKAAPATGSAS